MSQLSSWSELFFNSLQSIAGRVVESVPIVLGALMILLLGWLLAKLLQRIVVRFLAMIKFDQLVARFQAEELLRRANVSLSPAQFLGKFVYWIFMLLVVVSASDAMGWTVVSEELSKVVSYLPSLLVAIVFFVIGTYIASFVRDLIAGTSGSLGIGVGRMISNFVFYFLMAIVSLTALEQAGMDTSILTSNLLLFIGAILISAAVSYGIASRHILSNLLAGFYSRKTFRVGQIIELEGERGKIIQANNISVIIKNETGEKIVIPAEQLITNRVKIIEK